MTQNSHCEKFTSEWGWRKVTQRIDSSFQKVGGGWERAMVGGAVQLEAEVRRGPGRRSRTEGSSKGMHGDGDGSRGRRERWLQSSPWRRGGHRRLGGTLSGSSHWVCGRAAPGGSAFCSGGKCSSRRDGLPLSKHRCAAGPDDAVDVPGAPLGPCDVRRQGESGPHSELFASGRR